MVTKATDSCCYYKGQTKGTSNTSLWSPLCWLWREGFPSDISSDFVLPFTTSHGQKAKQTSLPFFWRELEDLQTIKPSAEGAARRGSFLTGWAGLGDDGLVAWVTSHLPSPPPSFLHSTCGVHSSCKTDQGISIRMPAFPASGAAKEFMGCNSAV